MTGLLEGRVSQRPAGLDASTSVYLDAARWIAALAVALQHLRRIAYADPSAVPTGPGAKLLLAFTSLGHEAVIVFFVVSGFLVGGLALQRPARFSAARYFADRFGRIYATLVPSLVLSFVLGALAFRSFAGASQVYPSTDLGLGAFIGNLLALQTIVVPMYGGNGPLWSLCNEWWYYVLFGCAMVCATRDGAARAVAVSAIVLVVWMLPVAISGDFLLWVLGAATCVLAARGTVAPPRWLCLAMFAIVLVASCWLRAAGRDHPLLPLVDLAVAAGFCLTVASMRGREPPRFARLHRRMASFSYSLYLVHMPVGLFLSAAVRQGLGGGPLSPGPRAALFVVSLILAYATALAMYALFESRSDRLKVVALDLIQRLGRRRLLAT